MELGLTGKVAWVLGASSGIGRACAQTLSEEGARVAISARGEEALHAAADDIAAATGNECVDVPLDLTDAAAIAPAAERVAESLGPVDILVGNAGGPPLGPLSDLTDDDLNYAFALDTASMWRLAKAVAPAMQERGSGCLIFMVSTSAKEPIPGLMLSNMMRPAVVGMAKTLAGELGPHGIRVVCVAPGRTETPRVRELDEARARADGTTVESVRATVESRIALRRYARPEEIAGAVTWLASDRASYVTGVTVVVDGGGLAGLLA